MCRILYRGDSSEQGYSGLRLRIGCDEAAPGHVREREAVKKARVIEDALNAHLDALAELPANAIIPTRIVLTAESGARLLERLAAEPQPTPALRELLRDIG